MKRSSQREGIDIGSCLILREMELLQELNGHESRVWHASWSPNGRKIASTGEDKVIRIWNRSSNSDTFVCIATLEEGQSKTIRCCEWSPDSTLIASASFDGSVVIWQMQDRDGKVWERTSALEGHDSEVKSVAWSGDGTFLATCGRDKKVWIWERLTSGDFECVAMLDGHTQDVKFVRWHPTMNVLFSCSYDDTIKVWMDDNDDWYCSQTLKGHSSTVWGLTLDSSGSRMVSVSDDKSAILWECESPANPEKGWWQVARLQNLHEYAIYSVDWSQHSGLIATGAGDNGIKLLSYGRSSDGVGALQELSAVVAHGGDVNCVRWCSGISNSGEVEELLSCGDDGIVKVWKVTS